MREDNKYFQCRQYNGPRSYWAVQGKDGELRSTFPDMQIARLFCTQLNAAFDIGQRELLKEQLEERNQ